MHHLATLMNARNIAVFGASKSPEKPGSMLLQILRMTGFSGKFAGINPQGGDIQGIPLYPSIREVPFETDLAVMIIPPAAVVGAIRECAEAGVKGVVISSEGFSESGPDGARHQEAIADIVKKTGIRVVGPNTLGILNTATGLTTSYYADAGALRQGCIGFAAQSGIFVGAFMRYLSSFDHLGISKGLGLGNKLDINESDALDFLADDVQTRVVGLYLEDIQDGRRFFAAAEKAVAKKPVLLIKGGRTSPGSRATASHTASMAVDDKILDGALAQSGVIRLSGIEEMLAALMGFTWAPLPRGNSIAIVTYSGAQSIMCIDLAADLGLRMAEFGPAARNGLSRVISRAYKAQNPVDIFPDMMSHGFEETMLAILDALLKDNGVNGIFFISFAIEGSEIYRPVVDMIHDRADKPVFFSLLGPRDEVQSTGDFLLRQKVPYFLYPEMGIRTFAHMWQYARQRNKRHHAP
ncbi:MAG: CoA-binding protein [Desulfobacterales bacterium]